MIQHLAFDLPAVWKISSLELLSATAGLPSSEEVRSNSWLPKSPLPFNCNEYSFTTSIH